MAMRAVLLQLLFVLSMRCGWCEEDVVFTFDGDVRDFAVGNDSVYVVTKERLYHLSHSLSPLQSRSQRGHLTDDSFQRVPEGDHGNATFVVNTMVPFVKNGTLITCGLTLHGCDYCELLDLKNISKSLHMEKYSLGSGPNDTFTGGLVEVEVGAGKTEVYILAAKRKYQDCGNLADRGIYLHDTNDHQPGGGGIFNVVGKIGRPQIWTRSDINFEFVDGFQINSTIYIFSKIPPDGKNEGRIRLIWLESKTHKTDTLKSLRGATLECCADIKRTSLRSSSVVPGGGPQVLWAGVFEASGSDSQDGANTALAIFDISPRPGLGWTDDDPDFCSICKDKDKGNKPRLLTPESVLFKHNSMTSVLAVRQKSWLVFFIGTGDGQLMKFAVDKAYQNVCPRVLYQTDDDRKVFHKMHLDPVDRKHVYVALKKQMKRVPVSQCEKYTDLEACWSAQDPYCGWCDSKNSCTFEDECPGSVWLSIPEDSSEWKIVSHRVEMNNGQIILTIQSHLSSSGDVALTNFACQFSTTIEHVCDLGGPAPQFPLCSCVFPSSRLPAEGLILTVRVRLGQTQLRKQLTLSNCSDITGPPTLVLCHQCIMAGCGWRNNTCSWTNLGADDSVCQTAESDMNYPKPEISSITPSVVSFHGRNHALMTGRNLNHVTRVWIQGDMDCSPKESPVWNNTGVSLTFHIPRADKGFVRICAVLPDGSCHGNAIVIYGSSPKCSRIIPDTTWASGKRRIMVQGSYLEFVEGVIHSHVPHTISYPTNTSMETLLYDTPGAANADDTSTSTVSLRVANETLPCPMKLTYHPDPHFINFTSTWTGAKLLIVIQKKPDKLSMTVADLSVQGVQDDKQYECVVETIKTSSTTDFVICEIQYKPDVKIQALKIKYGNITVSLPLDPPSLASNHDNANISNHSSPVCSMIIPDTTWASGNRRIMVQGSLLEFVEEVIHSHVPHTITYPTNTSMETLLYDTPEAENVNETSTSTVSLRVANETLPCPVNLTYHPDPHFINFTSTRTGDDLRIIIQKKPDKLNMTLAELSVQGVQGNEQHECVMEAIETGNDTDLVICEILNKTDDTIQALEIKYGNITVSLPLDPPSLASNHDNANISNHSSPVCSMIIPDTTWASGKRRIMVQGSLLEFVEGVIHSHVPHTITYPRNTSMEALLYDTPGAANADDTSTSTVSLRVANETLPCPVNLTYHPDPHFISFTTTRTGDDLRIIIQKKPDKLNMTLAELSVQGVQGNQRHECVMETIDTFYGVYFVICDILNKTDDTIQALEIRYGNIMVRLPLDPPSAAAHDSRLILIVLLLLITCNIAAVVFLYYKIQKRRTAQMKQPTEEELELDIRNDITQDLHLYETMPLSSLSTPHRYENVALSSLSTSS